MNNLLLYLPSEWAVTFLASFLIWLMYGALFLLWLKQKKATRHMVIHALLASAVTWIVVEMLKSFIPSVRPYQIEGYMPLTITVPFDSSFPSNHTAVAFALATSVWLHDKKMGYLFLLAAVGVALGRLLANVHYVFDVVFGLWIGFLVAYISSRVSFCREK